MNSPVVLLVLSVMHSNGELYYHEYYKFFSII